MSDMHIFNDPNKVPRPRDEIKIESMSVTPYADRFRVRVEVTVTAFQERPNLILALYDASGKLINDLNIIETMHADMEFTMHIRGTDDPAGEYALEAELFYETRNPPQDKRRVSLVIPEDDHA